MQPVFFLGRCYEECARGGVWVGRRVGRARASSGVPSATHGAWGWWGGRGRILAWTAPRLRPPQPIKFLPVLLEAAGNACPYRSRILASYPPTDLLHSTAEVSGNLTLLPSVQCN
jgi:hypothetical protein